MPDNKNIFDFLITGKLPGERIVELIFEERIEMRKNPTQENVETLRISNAMLRGWHNWWIDMGWPGEKILKTGEGDGK